MKNRSERMEEYVDFLSMEEQKSIQLKALFSRHHFQNYRLSAFESYDLYAKSREFATPQSVITFVGAKGQVMALKPDITLSIIKNTGNTEEKKVFYDEDVYRHDFHNEEYLRIHQLGIEHIGSLTHNDEREILELALESLNILGTNRLHLSHQTLVNELLSWFDEEKRAMVIQALNQKSVHELETYRCVDQLSDKRWQLLKDLLFATTADFDKMHQLFQTAASQNALAKLHEYIFYFDSNACFVDLSIASLEPYYSGLMFTGYLKDVAKPVLLGGQYDQLLKNQGMNQSGMGFAIYLDEAFLSERQTASLPIENEYLKIALPKGRMAQKVIEIFEKSDLCAKDTLKDNRQLIFTDEEHKLQFYLVKPSDAAIYVEHGVADIGVVGKDVLMESQPDVLELLDLNFGKCVLAIAGFKDFQQDFNRPLKVATKYANQTRDYFASIGQAVELIALHGSIEVAPLLGLSDVIVDIVETGRTLKENHLEVLKVIAHSSARLVANQAAYRFKQVQMNEVIKKVAQQL